jgi:hypothetical protein
MNHSRSSEAAKETHMNLLVREWHAHDGLIVDICEIFNDVDGVVFSTSKLNKNSESPPLPGFDEIEISNAGCI